MQIQDIAKQKAAAEKEIAAVEQALERAERAYDQEPSQSKRRDVRERREELAEARLGVERAERLEEAAVKAQAETERQAARETVALLAQRLRGPSLADAVAPLIEREKVARLELMQVSLELQRFAEGLREDCYTIERLDAQLHPSQEGAPHPHALALTRYHSVSDTLSVLWKDGVNKALEESVDLPKDVRREDPRVAALHAVRL